MIASTAFRSDERFTQKQFRRWVDQRPGSDINRYELIDGRIVMTPPAGWSHSSVASRLVYFLNEHVSHRNMGWVFESSAGYNLPSGDTVEPDVSFVDAERFAAQLPTRPDEFLRAVPNLVIEIPSTSTAKRDRTEKKDIYAHNGVHEYWIVDPRRKLVTVFHLGNREYDAGQVFTTGTLRSKVLPKLRIAVEKLFAL